jgi:hypothetical protein
MEEIFVNIVGFVGYKVSNTGKIKSFKCKTPRLMSCAIGGHGYPTIKLRREGRYFTFSVHRLVASHFLEKEDGKDVVNHIDGNKANNHSFNLEWVDHSENALHAYKHNLKSFTEEMKNTLIESNKKRRKPVVKIDRVTGETLEEYPSVTIAAEKMNAEAGDISKCCKGYRLKTVKGFVWRYKGEESLKYQGRHKGK